MVPAIGAYTAYRLWADAGDEPWSSSEDYVLPDPEPGWSLYQDDDGDLIPDRLERGAETLRDNALGALPWVAGISLSTLLLTGLTTAAAIYVGVKVYKAI